MNKIFIIFSLICLGLYSHISGQTEKGHFLIGGSASAKLSSSESGNSFYIILAPNMGYFIVDNLAIGSGLPISFTGSKNSSSFGIGLSPYARYYFHELENAKTFVNGGLGFGSTLTKFGSETQSSTNLMAYMGVGIAYFLNPNIGLETILSYNYTSINLTNSVSNLGVGVGFQIYLGQLKR